MQEALDAGQLGRDFDMTRMHGSEDPYSVYAALRERCPVAHSEAFGGFWVVSSYADVQRCARDTTRFSSTDGVTIPFNGLPLPGIPIMLDPPEHSKYRSLMQPWFSPGASALLEQSLRQFVVGLISGFLNDGSADLASDLADHVPAIVIGMMLGLNRDQWQDFGNLTNTMFRAAAREQNEEAASAAGEIVELLSAEITARQKEPRDDMLSKIAHLEIDGELISNEKMLGMAVFVLGAGYETTASGISVSLLLVSQLDEIRHRLLADPGAVPAAVEEVLRFATPLHGLARSVRGEASVGGVHLSDGERVMLLWASANRDERVFDRADEFVIDRPPGKHVAFGYGVHRCIGAPLARLEMTVVLEEVLRHMPNYQIDTAAVRFGGGHTRWVETLPATW